MKRAKSISPISNHLPIWVWPFILAVVTLIVYYPVYKFQLTNWDDQVYVSENPLIRDLSWKGIQNIFSAFTMGNYHPLVLLTYAIEYSFFKLNGGGYHVTKLILHFLGGLGFYAVLKQFKLSSFASGIGALAFLIHPFHVESVAWVTERKDVLYGCAWIWAWYAWNRSKGYDQWFGFAILGMIISCLSKGQAVTLPAAFLFTYLYRNNSLKIYPSEILKLLMPVIISIGFGILAVYAQQSGGNVREASEYTFLHQIQVAAWGGIFYITRTIFPVDLQFFYPYPPLVEGQLPIIFPISVVLFLGVIILIIVGIKKYYVAAISLLLFGILWLPISQLLPVGNAIAADRYHYIPSVGLFILLAWGIDQTLKNKWALQTKGISIIWIISCGIISIQTLPRWKDPESLWKAVIQEQPKLMFAYKNLAKYIEKKGNINGAMEVYTSALQQDSTYAVGYNELGVLLKNQGNPDAAFNYFNKSIALEPKNKEALLNIGTWYDQHDQAVLAKSAYYRALQLDKNYAEAWNNLGNSYFRTGNPDSALICVNEAIRIFPQYHEAWNNRGTQYAARGKYPEALKDFSQALNILPQYAEPMFNIGLVKSQTGQNEEALEWYRKAAKAGSPRAIQLLQQNGITP